MIALPRLRFLPLATLLLLPAPMLWPQEEPAPDAAPAAPTSEIAAQLEELNTRIRTKIEGGARNAADFAPEATEFETLVSKYEGSESSDYADLLVMHAMFAAQVLRNEEIALRRLRTVSADFSDTKAGEFAALMLQRIETERQKQELADQLVGQPAPELNFNWASREGLKQLSDLRGKVVVLDFWATWCGPCIRSFPQVRELTAHYAGAPVEVVGVTSLQGRVHGLESTPIDTAGDPQKEYDLTARFGEKMDVTWTVAFSEEKVFNPDYGVTGIPHMAIIAPDGTVRHTGLHPAMPHAEKVALIDAILSEFELPVPGSDEPAS